jgi:hypothetical protein
MTIQQATDQLITALRDAAEQGIAGRNSFAAAELHAFNGAPTPATQGKIAARPSLISRVREAFPGSTVTTKRATGDQHHMIWIIEPDPTARGAELGAVAS